MNLLIEISLLLFWVLTSIFMFKNYNLNGFRYIGLGIGFIWLNLREFWYIGNSGLKPLFVAVKVGGN